MNGIQILKPGNEKILTPDALEFLAKLNRAHNPTRLELLQKREERQLTLDEGVMPTILTNTKNWKVADCPVDLQKRHVDITGPTDKKMLINALNSGADTFMADFEDATSPTWHNIVEGQSNLVEAIDGTLSFTNSDGKEYKLHDKRAVLIVRPRGWHLDEKHMLVDGMPISASLFDFGMYLFHNAKRLLAKNSGPYYYLPKLENHLEARLWNDVFITAQKELGLAPSTIRATVLIETILAAFEMEEILYELKDHVVGLNAGRWDYIFSIIKKFQKKEGFVLPDRSQITMTVPFMRAYTNLLIATCHKRGAHAMGGMAAFVPSRKDAEVNKTAFQKVTEDKTRESQDGFDGTWVAHPDLVPVAREVFAKFLGNKPNQKDRLTEATVTPEALLDFTVPNGTITAATFAQNIDV
ncbi:MAG: malate synthase, partial [Chlamydiales bacterium]|nr:malate synthase [Chlamydiales bacterium]